VGLFFVVLLAACASQPAAPTQAPGVESAPTEAAAPTTGAAAGAPAATEAAAQPPASGGEVSFAKDILPMFEDSCVSCHGGERTSRALDLKTYENLMAGSQNGPVITPGDAAASKLVQAIQAGKMPKRGAKWTADQLKLLVDWVNAGAQNN
jgi:hypothetical protein